MARIASTLPTSTWHETEGLDIQEFLERVPLNPKKVTVKMFLNGQLVEGSVPCQARRRSDTVMGARARQG